MKPTSESGRTIHPTGTQPYEHTVSTDVVFAAVRVWELCGRLIPVMVAREIAAWFQSPGTDGSALAAFSTAGEVTDGVSADIRTALRLADGEAADSPQLTRVRGDMGRVLLALSAYVGACTVAPYLVTHNAPGCLPDGDPYAHTLDYEAACASWRDMVREVPGMVLPPTCECVDDGGEACTGCVVDALARSHATDNGLPRVAPAGIGPWDHVVAITPGDEPVHTRVYVIAREPMSAADFFAGTGDALPTLPTTVGAA